MLCGWFRPIAGARQEGNLTTMSRLPTGDESYDYQSYCRDVNTHEESPRTATYLRLSTLSTPEYQEYHNILILPLALGQ